jgi:hypothetical protein
MAKPKAAARPAQSPTTPAAPVLLPQRSLQQTRALDALGHLDEPISALRAIEALTECYRADSEVDMPGLHRNDLASLIGLVTNDLEQRRQTARAIINGAQA